MTELRTMKDIEPGIAFSGKEVKELGLKFSDMKKVEFIQSERDKNIKLEAIKWINYDGKLPEFPDLGGTPMILSEIEQCLIRCWIKHFFNITDEDLK